MKQFSDKKLFELLKEKNAATIRIFLESLSEKEKGTAFEGFLADLYQGNGWLVELKGGRGDKGADIILYHPKTPSKASYIVQARPEALSYIIVTQGQTVSQGDIIGYLYYLNNGSHVHWGLIKDNNWVCPEPYFTADARLDMLDAIHKTYPSADMCY
jgi:hypothetical protein